MGILRFYRTPGLKTGQLKNKLRKITQIETSVIALETETCYYVETTDSLNEEEVRTLKWILAPPFERECFRSSSVFDDVQVATVIEIGPR